MTVSTAQTKPAKRPRRRVAVVLAVLFLLIGAALLSYSFFWQAQPRTSSASPIPTTTRSPVAQTQTVAATQTSGATGAPPVVIVTTFVVVPTFVNPPASSSAQDSDTLALVTTVSGLLASLAGIVSAVVSMRGNRSR